MKKSRITIRLNKLLSDKYFEQVCKDQPEVLEKLGKMREYYEEVDRQNLIRLRKHKINKLRNETDLEK